MCQFENATPTATGEDEWLLDNPQLRAFIGAVNEIKSRENDPKRIVDAIRPHFKTLLADSEWLPASYQEEFENSGMGGGIGMWLLYRAGDGSLGFSTLVVPPGAQTPVHDHLAWGLVGLYRGTQDEDVYERVDDGADEDRAVLKTVEQNSLVPGDFYELMASNDIHRVRTTSDVTSVSLHLLGNDNGCIWRHRFYPDEEKVVAFKSGYVNVPCRETAEVAE
jgi:predicted metal-dependent enzyme (double-stranded beta helix superfamily)